MQAIERELSSNNWVTLLFVCAILVLFFLKLFKAEKMKMYTLSIFNKGFIEIESQEEGSDFSFFHIAYTGFSFISISLTVYFFIHQFTERGSFSFFDYGEVSLYVLGYMSRKIFFRIIIDETSSTKRSFRALFFI